MKNKFLIKAFAICSKGLKREKNEDCVGVNQFVSQDDAVESKVHQFKIDEESNFFAIADGVGGLNSGEYASKYVINKLKSLYPNIKNNLDLLSSLKKINDDLNDIKEPFNQGCASTLSAVLMNSKNIYTVNLGDTRIYEIGKNNLIQLSKDHIAHNKNGNNVITQYLGGGMDTNKLNPFIESHTISQKKYLLCSDGIYNLVNIYEIYDTILKYDCIRALTELTKMANNQGGSDNLSLIILEIINDIDYRT